MPTKTLQQKRPAKAMVVSRIGQRRQIVIPKEVFDALHLAEGDFMEVTAENGRVAMKRKKLVDADDTLTAAEAAKVRHAEIQVKTGKTRPWSQVKHELGL
jgi:AbrB family looped-hinge helix DNA binding protein